MLRNTDSQEHEMSSGERQTQQAANSVTPVTSLAGKSESIWAENRCMFSRGCARMSKEQERASGEACKGPRSLLWSWLSNSFNVL